MIFSLTQGFFTAALHGEINFSLGTDNSVCAGLGVATCQKVGKVAWDVGFSIDVSTTTTWSKDFSDSVSLGFTYSYTTTDNPYIPGKLGDMFLTPSLNVKFSKSALISFDPDSCAGSSKEIVTWSLDSPSNVPVSLISSWTNNLRSNLHLVVGVLMAKLR